MRERIASTLGVPTSTLRLDRNQHGAPVLDDGAHHVSLSDHGAWLVLAVSSDGPVGVDVLTVPDDVHFVADTSLVLSVAEIMHVRTAEPERRAVVFATCWTRKEAYAKCVGTGLTAGLADVSLTPAAPSDLGVHFRVWQLDGATVALASKASPPLCVALHAEEGVLT